jgi:hypothetical protein
MPAPSQVTMDLIDLTIDNDEAPVLTTLSHRDMAILGCTPISTLSFPAGRGTVVHDPKDLTNQATINQSVPSQISLELSPATWLLYLIKNLEQ